MMYLSGGGQSAGNERISEFLGIDVVMGQVESQSGTSPVFRDYFVAVLRTFAVLAGFSEKKNEQFERKYGTFLRQDRRSN